MSIESLPTTSLSVKDEARARFARRDRTQDHGTRGNGKSREKIDEYWLHELAPGRILRDTERASHDMREIHTALVAAADELLSQRGYDDLILDTDDLDNFEDSLTYTVVAEHEPAIEVEEFGSDTHYLKLTKISGEDEETRTHVNLPLYLDPEYRAEFAARFTDGQRHNARSVTLDPEFADDGALSDFDDSFSVRERP